MDYRFLLKVSPPAFFGLPDGSRIVVPVKPESQQIVGPAFDPRTGHLVMHGTLSHYRNKEEKLQFELRNNKICLSINDNFFEFSFSAATNQEAENQLIEAADHFVRSMSVLYGTRFWYTVVVAEVDGVPYHMASVHSFPILNATIYNLEQLQHRITDVFRWSSIINDRLNKALQYYDFALLLFETFVMGKIGATHTQLIVASAFLQFWKAITTVLGEPGTDRDYQRRFREIGFPKDFWSSRISPLYDIRNEEDVAHYSLSYHSVTDLLNQFKDVSTVCKDVISTYAEYLLKLQTKA